MVTKLDAETSPRTRTTKDLTPLFMEKEASPLREAFFQSPTRTFLKTFTKGRCHSRAVSGGGIAFAEGVAGGLALCLREADVEDAARRIEDMVSLARGSQV